MSGGMYWKFGSYKHQVGSVDVQNFSIRTEFDDNDIELLERHTLAASGRVYAGTAKEVDDEVDKMISEYRKHNQSGGLFHADGTPTTHYLDSNKSISGVRVLSIAWQHEPAAFCGFRGFTVTLEAEYDISPLSGAGVRLWEEQVDFTGTGGKSFRVDAITDGEPVKQGVFKKNPVSAVQSGRAIGIRGYPTFSRPLWPQHEQEDLRRTGFATPKNRRRGKRDYPINWSYSFLAARPLQSGAPSFT